MNQQDKLKTGAELILEERNRQIRQEGFTPSDDDQYTCDELLQAAVVYVAASAKYELASETPWPWDSMWFKHTSDIRSLTKAGALIAAEIDRRIRKGEQQ